MSEYTDLKTQNDFALCTDFQNGRSSRRGLCSSPLEGHAPSSAMPCLAELNGFDNGNDNDMALKKELTSGNLNQLSKCSAEHRLQEGLQDQQHLPKDFMEVVTHGRTTFFKNLNNKIDSLIRNSLEKQTDFLVATILQGIKKSGYGDIHSMGNCKKSTHMKSRFNEKTNLEYGNPTKMSKQKYLDFDKSEATLLHDEMDPRPSGKPCPSDFVTNEDLARTKNSQSVTEKMNQFENMSESPQSPNFDLINGFDLSMLEDPNFDINFLDNNLRGDLTNHMDIDQEDFLSADNAPPCGEAFDNMLFKMLNEENEPCNDRINDNKQDTIQDYEDFSTMNEMSITKDSEDLSNLEKIILAQDYEDFSTMNEMSIIKDSENLSNLEKIIPTKNHEDVSTMNEGGINKDSEDLTNLENIIHTKNFEDLNTLDETNTDKDSGTPHNFEDLNDIWLEKFSQDNQKGVIPGSEMSESLNQDLIQGTPYNFEDLEDIMAGNSKLDNPNGITPGSEISEGLNQDIGQGVFMENGEQPETPTTSNRITEDKQGTLERDNPDRTKFETVNNIPSSSNIDAIRFFMEILDEARAKEAPTPDQLQLENLATCPTCGITTKDMLEMLKHFSSKHYKPYKHEGTYYFCSLCKVWCRARCLREQSRHLTTKDHITRTFINLFIKNNIKTSKGLNKSVENYLKALPHLDLANQAEPISTTGMIHTIIIYVCCIYHKWHSTEFSKDPVRFLSRLNKEVGQWIIFSSLDISKIPNTRLNFKEEKDTEHRDQIRMVKENKQDFLTAIIRNKKIENPKGIVTLIISCKIGTENSLEEARLSLMQIYKMAKSSTWGIERKLKGHRLNSKENYPQIPTLVLHCQTNNKEEMTNTNEFFSNLFKTIKMSKSNIAKQLEGKIKYISSEQNYVADSLSRSRRIKITKDDDGLPPLSDEDATKILKQIELPESYTISRELFQKYVSSEGMKSPIKKINKKTTTKAKITNKSLEPPKKSKRKAILPPTSSDHIFYREQRRRLREDPPEFLKQTPTINHMNIEGTPKITNEKSITQKINKFIDKTCFLYNTRLEEVDNYDDQERIRLNNRIYKDGLITIPMFKECQSMDPVCQKIQSDLTKNKSFFEVQGVLCKRQETTKGVKELLALPKSLIPILRHALHFGILAHHASANNMYLKLKDHYWFPNLRDELKRITRSCVLCATLKPNAGRQLKFGEEQFPNSPRIGYAFDIACGLPIVNSYQYCYIFLDLFSGYSITVPAKSKSSKEILKAFKTNVIQYFDFPNFLYGDCEMGLHSKEMKAFCEAHNIELRHNSPHSAFSNGNCETEINKIKTTLRMLDRGQGESWVDMITYANLGINHRKLTASGFSPQILALGQDTQTLALLKESEDFKNQGEYSTFITKRLDEAYDKHRKQRKILADKNREYVNKSRTEKSFQVGELVVLKNHEIATIGGGGLKDKFHGIYKITSMNKKERTCILTHIGNGSERGAHLMHLRPIGEENIEDPLPIRNEAIQLINKGQKSKSELGTEGRSYNLRSNTSKLSQ